MARKAHGDERRILGQHGERLAVRHLRRNGYRILARNLSVGRYEADIIALDPDGSTMVVVEVKTRRGDCMPPESGVGWAKQRSLARLAEALGGRRALVGRALRVDVIAIRWPASGTGPGEVRHLKDAVESCRHD